MPYRSDKIRTEEEKIRKYRRALFITRLAGATMAVIAVIAGVVAFIIK